MRIVSFLILLCAFSSIALGQEYVYGPSFSLDRTSFNIPDTSILIIGGPGGGGVGSENLGRESNFSAGGYFFGFPSDRAFYGGELIYSRQTATRAEGVVVNSINIIPQFGFDPLDINLFLNGGIGAGYLLSINGIDNMSETNQFDIIIKAGLAYRVKNIITIEAGIRGSVTDFESSSEVTRESIYIGAKIPLNQLISK